MNSERLQLVARAVAEGDGPEINMNVFFNDCGTPGCAIGHYAARKDLQSEYESADTFVQRTDGVAFPAKYLSVIEDGFIFMYAGIFQDFAKHFDVTHAEATGLFGSSGCNKAKTKEEVVDYIENFIAEHEDTAAAEELIQSTKEEQHELVEQRR